MQTFLDTKIASDQAARRQEQLPRLCGETAAIVRRAWGRGPVKTTAHWAGPNILVVMLELGLTDAETTLRATGHTEQLLAGRQLLDQIIQDELTCSVEQITGRQVETMLSATRLDPDLCAQIFVLAHPGGNARTHGPAAHDQSSRDQRDPCP